MVGRSSLESIIQHLSEADVLKPVLPHCAQCDVETADSLIEAAVFHNPYHCLEFCIWVLCMLCGVFIFVVSSNQ